MERKNYNGGTLRKSLPKGDRSREGTAISEHIRIFLLSFAVGALTSLVLLLAGAAIAHSTADPGAIEKPLSFAALFIGIAAGAFVLARGMTEYKFPSVLLFSSIFVFMLFISRLILKSTGAESLDNSFYSYLGIPASALLGLLTSGISRRSPRPTAKKKMARLAKKRK